MEILLVVIVAILAMAGMFWFSSRSIKRTPLTYVRHLRLDVGKRYLHLLGPRTHQPEYGDSYDVWYHLIFDLESHTFITGGSQHGKDLSLGSPFVVRTLDTLRKRTGVPLELPKEKKGPNNPSWPIIRRDAGETDTELVKPQPDHGLILWAQGSDGFSLDMRQNGKSLMSWGFKGDAGGMFFRHCWIDDDRLAICYVRNREFSSGAALAILSIKDKSTVWHDAVIPFE